MNRKLKLIFEVVEAADGKFDPATNQVVVAKSQMVFEVMPTVEELDAHMRVASHPGDGRLLALALPSLARDHLAELRRALEAAAQAQDPSLPMRDEIRAKCKAIRADQKWVDEVLECLVGLLKRSVRLRLREWAQRKLEKAKETAA
jgi:hypothetical protein